MWLFHAKPQRFSSIWNDWLADLKAKAKIIDNQHVFF